MSPDADMELIGEYDEIEIPPVKPYVVRHRRFACRCAHCGAGVKAPAPLSPRRRHLDRAFMLWRYIARAFKRFPTSVCASCSARFRPDRKRGRADEYVHPLSCGVQIEADKAKAILRQAKVVASDETGVRIEGTNSYHWVFHCKDAVVHQPDYSRAARVVAETMNGHTPNV